MSRSPASGDASDPVHALGPWFHNLHLCDGRQTAPQHPLGDFPANKWRQIEPHLPASLDGWRALDIGCNAGFYSLELARRGAHVLGIDKDPHFLRQALWAAEHFGLTSRLEFRRMQVYELARLPECFDCVLFCGVFYHLRYPQLALDLVAEKAERLLVFQTLTMPDETTTNTPDDLPLDCREHLTEPGWPKMAFIEKLLAGDETNWWAPNHACVEALLRSTGLRLIARPGHEIYICAPAAAPLTAARAWDETELRIATGVATTRSAVGTGAG